ncbi:MAG TPA: hypothetical protein VEB41_11145 [Burkholderiales bacterium]|nr:hypothetical protein [Burkholderiales bacterium]
MKLRTVLWMDALTCVFTGLALSLFSARLSGWLGLPEPLLFYAGLFLFPTAAFMAWTASRATMPAPAVWMVIGGNALWVLGSLLVLAMSPTAFGYASVIAQAAAVAVLAELEYLGLRTGLRG